MSTIPEDIRSAFLGVDPLRNLLSSDGQNRIAENHARQEWFGDRVCFCVYTLRSTENEDTTDGTVGSQPFREFWDVEFWSTDAGQSELARRLARDNFHLHDGTFGAGQVQGVFANDHTGDYVPRVDYSGMGLQLAAMDFEIVGYEPGA